MDGAPTRFDARGGRGGVGRRAGCSPDQVVVDRSRTSASGSRRTDDHEGRRAQDLGIGEARFGRVGDIDCKPSPGRGLDDA